MKLKSRSLFSLFFLSVILLNFFSSHSLYKLHTNQQTAVVSRLAEIPHTLAKAMCLEFPGVLSDYLMLMVLTFHGEHLIYTQKLTEQEWKASLRTTEQAVNLDPQFWDPYVVAQMSYPWEGGMVKETNELLLKGAEARVNDYRPYYYLWFNNYFILDDPETAGPYLQKSAKKPGAPFYFTTLAARMSLYTGKTKAGILFLQQMLSEATDPAAIKHIEKRLIGFMSIDLLENAVAKYKEKFNSFPDDLNELVVKGFLRKLPPDPYGGEFYLMPDSNGRVYTTSKLAGRPTK